MTIFRFSPSFQSWAFPCKWATKKGESHPVTVYGIQTNSQDFLIYICEFACEMCLVFLTVSGLLIASFIYSCTNEDDEISHP